jgi:hypothetical protein
MKKPFYDIIPNDKRSIRNIPLTKKVNGDPFGAHNGGTNENMMRSNAEILEETRDEKIHHGPSSHAAASSRSTNHSMDGIRSAGSRTTSNPSSSSLYPSSRSSAQAEPKLSRERIESEENEYDERGEHDIEPEIVDEDLENPAIAAKAANGTVSPARSFASKIKSRMQTDIYGKNKKGLDRFGDEDEESEIQIAAAAREDGEGNDLEEESFEEWRSGKKNSFWRGWVALGILAVALVVIYSLYFGSATIIINPVQHDLVLKQTNIPLDSIKHEDISTDGLSGSQDVAANGSLKVDRKATGKITLYNAYNSSDQKLVAGTRLETPNGLVYKLKSAVTVPAQKTVSGKKVPGSVDADVEASESGDKYNQGLKDFGIVAYKGTDKYDTIYGRSRTALANGFSGNVPNISTKDINAAVATIKAKIAQDADAYFAKKAKSKGDPYVYIPATKQITYDDVKQDVSKDGKTAAVKLTAKAAATLFDSTELFAQIIKQQTDMNVDNAATTSGSTSGSSTGAGDASTFDNQDNVGQILDPVANPAEIVYTGDASKLLISMGNSSNILVSGTTTISSAIDLPKISKAVSGLSKEQAIGAIKRLVELETIAIDIRPWWNKNLPSADKIEIKTEE